MKRIILWTLVVLVFSACKKDDDDAVVELKNGTKYTFKVSIEGFWSEATHPQDYPGNARFGKIVGISHRNENVLFKKGSKAASWMQSYFEDENTTAFASYFADYKDGDRVDAVIVADGFGATKESSFEFVTDGKHHKVSLLMQLSPAPDWFVAINNVELNALASGGYVVYVVNTWDAGLYSGTTYTGKGGATNENIATKVDAPLNYPDGGVNKFATIRIQYKSSEKSDS